MEKRKRKRKITTVDDVLGMDSCRDFLERISKLQPKSIIVICVGKNGLIYNDFEGFDIDTAIVYLEAYKLHLVTEFVQGGE